MTISQKRKQQLIDFWKELGDIPIDHNENIEENFSIWEIGTNKYEIWHYFDEEYDGGLQQLLNDINYEY